MRFLYAGVEGANLERPTRFYEKGRVAREIEHADQYDFVDVTDPDGVWFELVHPKPPHGGPGAVPSGLRSATNR